MLARSAMLPPPGHRPRHAHGTNQRMKIHGCPFECRCHAQRALPAPCLSPFASSSCGRQRGAASGVYGIVRKEGTEDAWQVRYGYRCGMSR